MLFALFIAVLLVIWLVVISRKLLCSNVKHVRWLAVVPVSVLVGGCYLVYTAFYPNDDFYQDEWQRNVGFELPPNAVFVDESVTYPDIHGDYSAVAVLSLPPSEMVQVRNQLDQSPRMKLDTSGQTITTMVKGFDSVVDGIDFDHPAIAFVSKNGPWFRVSLLKDGATLVFERHSS